MSQDHEDKIRVLQSLANLPVPPTWQERVGSTLHLMAWVLFLCAALAAFSLEIGFAGKYSYFCYHAVGSAGGIGALCGLVASFPGRPIYLLSSAANLSLIILIPIYEFA